MSEQIVKIIKIRNVSLLSGLTRARMMNPVPAFAQSPAMNDAKGSIPER